jgi:small subunit ribosomal protein S9
MVNKRPFEEYFASAMVKMIIKQPLVVTETTDKFDIIVRVRGGGYTGQAGALRLGISRALVEFNPELRPKLKAAGFLTRDSRKVERKKYGQPGARKRFQYSKR